MDSRNVHFTVKQQQILWINDYNEKVIQFRRINSLCTSCTMYTLSGVIRKYVEFLGKKSY